MSWNEPPGASLRSSPQHQHLTGDGRCFYSPTETGSDVTLALISAVGPARLEARSSHESDLKLIY